MHIILLLVDLARDLFLRGGHAFFFGLLVHDLAFYQALKHLQTGAGQL